MSRILCILFIYFIAVTSVFAEPLDTDPTISKYEINLINIAAECLSIKASPAEKNSFITAAYLDEKVMDSLFSQQGPSKIIDKQIQLQDRDFDNILVSLKKYCPNTIDKIKFRYKYFENKKGNFAELLQNQIVTMIFSEVANKNDKVKRFEAINKPVGGVNSLAY